MAQSENSRGSQRSLFAFLPMVWSRYLFPADLREETQWRWSSLFVLLIVPGLLLYPCLSFYLFEPDEGRYAQIPREMLERNDWVVPHLQGKPYLDKPPLVYWLVMASYSIFGYHDWAARLVPALALHACILISYFFGRRLLGERSAFWGSLLLSLAPGFIGVGRLLVLDGILAFWIVLSWFAIHMATSGSTLKWAWWLIAAVACGLGILTKGPIAIVLLVPPLIAYQWLIGWPCSIGRRAWLVFAFVVIGVTLPWYTAICLRNPEFAVYFLWEHNVVRFLDPFDHIRPMWFYVPVILAGLLPAALFGWGLTRRIASIEEADLAEKPRDLGFLLLFGGWCFLFFSLAGSKLPTYILPCFPPFALALGHYWLHSRWTAAWIRWLPASAMFVMLLIAHYWAIPWYAEFRTPMQEAAVARYCGDPATPVICYPRPLDSVAFYVGRDDFENYRSKDTPEMITVLEEQPRTVILFTHRHSLEALREVLPKHLQLIDETPISRSWRNFKTEYCYMAVVVRR